MSAQPGGGHSLGCSEVCTDLAGSHVLPEPPELTSLQGFECSLECPSGWQWPCGIPLAHADQKSIMQLADGLDEQPCGCLVGHGSASEVKGNQLGEMRPAGLIAARIIPFNAPQEVRDDVSPGAVMDHLIKQARVEQPLGGMHARGHVIKHRGCHGKACLPHAVAEEVVPRGPCLCQHAIHHLHIIMDLSARV